MHCMQKYIIYLSLDCKIYFSSKVKLEENNEPVDKHNRKNGEDNSYFVSCAM